MKQVIETLEAERADVQERLAWLEQQLAGFRRRAGEQKSPPGPAPPRATGGPPAAPPAPPPRGEPAPAAQRRVAAKATQRPRSSRFSPNTRRVPPVTWPAA